jgi:myo-inositol-1(or 4)-monophosphatase
MINDAKEIALLGGKYLKDNFMKNIRVDIKGYKDLVTEVDYKCEEIVIEEIERRFPSHSILSEEKGLIDKNSEYKWILDPLDGTINFAKGIPLFGIILSLLHKDETILGVIYLPMLNELYYCEKNKGAYLNDIKINVSNTSDLQKALISIGDFNIGKDDNMKKQDNIEMLNIINRLSENTMRTRCFGAASVDLCFLASGKTDALFYAFCSPWDVLAGELLLKECGGKITYIGNNNIYSNANLHNDIINKLTKL